MLVGKPYIITVYPAEGWTTGGTRLCIVGMNFYEGVEVVFGTLPASSEVNTTAIACWPTAPTFLLSFSERTAIDVSRVVKVGKKRFLFLLLFFSFSFFPSLLCFFGHFLCLRFVRP